MRRIFAIGDIHGCSKTFKKLLLDKICIKKTDKIYCLGDYIDRGTDSKGVIDLIINLREQGYHIHTIRGNHEQMMMDSIQSEEKLKHWIKNGGKETLQSFHISSYDKLKPVYKSFLKRTKYFIESANYIFVHAGLNFQIQNPFTDKSSMLWIRDFTFNEQKLGKRIVIHGHSPISFERVLNQQGKSVINIDGGCVYKGELGYGNLIALNITENKIISVRNIDK